MDRHDPRCEPVDMQVDLSVGLTISWSDGVEHAIPVRELRLRSPCAQWREYTKGRTPEHLQLIHDSVPADIVLRDAREVGHYALGFEFSDGHKSGIFEFHHLREIGDELLAVTRNQDLAGEV